MHRRSRLFARRLVDDGVRPRAAKLRLSVLGAGAAACTICMAVAVDVPALNGSLPVNISNSTIPEREDVGALVRPSPSASSGDM